MRPIRYIETTTPSDETPEAKHGRGNPNTTQKTDTMASSSSTMKKPVGSVLSRVQLFEQVNEEIRKTSISSASPQRKGEKSLSISSSSSSPPQKATSNMDDTQERNNHQQIMETFGNDFLPAFNTKDTPKTVNSSFEHSFQGHDITPVKNTLQHDDVAGTTTNQSRRRNISSSRLNDNNQKSDNHTPDPLDREAKHKSHQTTTSYSEKLYHASEVTLNDPGRRRKFKLAEESMKREKRDRGMSESRYSSASSTKSEDDMKFTNISRGPVAFAGTNPWGGSGEQQYNQNRSMVSSRGEDPPSLTSPSSLPGTRTRMNRRSADWPDEMNQVLPVVDTMYKPQRFERQPPPTSTHDYFSINENTTSKDDDDETQFNSVYMPDAANDKQKKDPYSDAFAAAQGIPIFDMREGKTLNAYPNEKKYHDTSSSDYAYDDDDESYTDNRSWTGRMRARKAAQEAMSVDHRMMEKLDHRRVNVTSLKKGNRMEDIDDNISVTSRVIQNVERERKLAYADAKEGVNEVTQIARNDPTAAAVGAGVIAGLMGTIALGPLGLLIGAGVAGVGYKVAQLPENERAKVGSKASTVAQKLHKSAVKANDFLSNQCAQACGDGKASSPTTYQEDEIYSRRSDVPTHISNSTFGISRDSPVKEATFTPKNIQPPSSINISSSVELADASSAVPVNVKRTTRRITPACRRMGRITPVGQIHSLDPALHPRAWLDVMASAWTSKDEKNEAMEEILLLSKDKNHARMLLEVGFILFLMFVILITLHSQ